MIGCRRRSKATDTAIVLVSSVQEANSTKVSNVAVFLKVKEPSIMYMTKPYFGC